MATKSCAMALYWWIKKHPNYTGGGFGTVQISDKDEYEVVKKILYQLPFDVIDNYEDWVRVGIYLKKFGDAGKSLWCNWTNDVYLSVNPKSKRVDLDYKWDSFRDERREITFGTILHFAKQYNITWKRIET